MVDLVPRWNRARVRYRNGVSMVAHLWGKVHILGKTEMETVCFNCYSTLLEVFGDTECHGWHEPGCPLFPISESDCAYDLMKCTCGWINEEKQE